MKSIFSLPDNWVYVGYEDGSFENVANTDTLSKAEAEEYRREWQTARKKRVVSVVLVTPKHELLRRFTYK